jgi:ABC-2 type transport system permease protein
MLNYKTIAVIKKELRDKLLSKSFILMTLLIPLFMFGIIGVQTLLMSAGESDANIILVSEDPALIPHLQEEFNQTEYVKTNSISLTYESISRAEVESFVNKNKAAILSGEQTGIIFIPSQSLEDKKLEFYSQTPRNANLLRKIKEPVNKVLVDRYFEGKNITDKDLSYAKNDIEFSEYKLTSAEEIEEAGLGNMVVAFILTFLLYMSLLMIGSMMMSSVIEEKTSRVVEVLLSSLDSRDLLTGKILGTAITSVLQMLIWLSPLIVIISTTWFILPAEFIVSLKLSQILYFLLNYFIALITFLGLFASVGSIFENAQDAQQGVWPIMILVMIPFFIAIAMMENPENSIARIASMLPIASLIVMPARMSIVDIPLWQLSVSVLINIGTLLLIFMLAAKIYRTGIMMTGKKPKWSEVAKWIRLSN